MGAPFLADGNHILWAWTTVIGGIPKAFLIQICASLILLPMLTNCPLSILKADVYLIRWVVLPTLTEWETHYT